MRKVNFKTGPVVWAIIGLQCMSLSAFTQNGFVYAAVHTPTKFQQKTDTEKVPDKASDKQTLSVVLKDLNKTKGVFFLYSDQSLGKTAVNPVSEKERSEERRVGKECRL